MERLNEVTIAVRGGDENNVNDFRRAVLEKAKALAREFGITGVEVRLATHLVEERIDQADTEALDKVSIPASNNLITDVPIQEGSPRPEGTQ